MYNLIARTNWINVTESNEVNTTYCVPEEKLYDIFDISVPLKPTNIHS